MKISMIVAAIMNSQSHQLPVGLIAQLVEHYKGITEVMGSNPIQALITDVFKT